MSLNFDYLLKYAFYWIINTHFELYMHFVDLYIHFVAQPPLACISVAISCGNVELLIYWICLCLLHSYFSIFKKKDCSFRNSLFSILTFFFQKLSPPLEKVC